MKRNLDHPVAQSPIWNTNSAEPYEAPYIHKQKPVNLGSGGRRVIEHETETILARACVAKQHTTCFMPRLDSSSSNAGRSFVA